MLLSFSVKNFRSFAQEAELFMSKRSFKTNHPKYGDWAAVVNPAAGIFGANASGKTTLIYALDELVKLPAYSMVNDSLVKGLYNPHKLSEEEDVEFLLDFVHGAMRYRWQLVIGPAGVVYESVWVSERRQFKMIFERDEAGIDFGPSSDIAAVARGFIEQGATDWVSVTSPWIKAKSSGKFAGAFKWLSRQIHLLTPASLHRGLLSPFVNTLLEEEKWRELASPMLRFADVGVDSVSVEEHEVPKAKRALFENVLKVMNEVSSGEKTDSPQIPDKETVLTFAHVAEGGRTFELEHGEESTGTRVWMDTALPALHTIFSGGVLLVDEIDSSLHPLLVRQLVGMFTDPEINRNGAQLIFTSHDMTLLGNFPDPALDMEAAWLCEKNDSYSSLKSIDEFKLPKTANAEKRYMQGAFGAVPLVPHSELVMKFASLVGEFNDESVSLSAKGR